MNFINPLTLLLIPLLGSFIIILIKDNNYIKITSINYKYVPLILNNETIGYKLNSFQSSKYNKKLIKQIALITSVFNFFISIIMWIQFDSSYAGYQFLTFPLSTSANNDLSMSFLQLNFGVDGISLYFILLTTFITPIAILASYNDIDKHLKFFLISILILETLQIAVFVALDLLLFYVFFESVLIPLFLMIGIWGASEARIRASFLFFLYTLFGSLWMLLAILKIYTQIGSTDFILLASSTIKGASGVEISFESQKILWIAFFIALAIKTPLFPLHGWLFRAHVEAPLAASMILAAIILKLATYAYLRILLTFLPDATQYFSPLVQSICIITLIYASLSALRTHDSKALVALSSVSHCAVIVLGLFSNTIIGIEGAILLSLAHGFVSPALFFCVGGCLYQRLHTRTLIYIRGITTYMPIFSVLFLFFILANASIPLTAGWVSEQLVLIGMFEKSPFIGSLGALSIFLTACYSLFLYNRIAFGDYSTFLRPIKDIDYREFIVLISLLIPTLILGIWPNLILDSLHLSVSYLIIH